MEPTDDGGPAFPHVEGDEGANGGVRQLTVTSPGMTLRDYFAGQALARVDRDPGQPTSPAGIARHCYRLADALLAARKA